MLNKICFFIILFCHVTAYAKEYINHDDGIIHTTTLQSSWCGNLAVSTKMGKLTDSGRCIYQKETQVQGFDSCEPLKLHGGMLERNAGSGFNCAATHVYSNVTGHDGLDEYTLISDSDGHYINTVFDQGNINLG